MNVLPAGVLALPAAALAGAIALAAGSTRGTAPSPVRVVLEVVGVLPIPESPAGILILREKGEQTILPIMVPDGRALAARERSREGYGLLGEAIKALGARVVEVEIEQAAERSSGARVRISQRGRSFDVHASTSESVALAMSTRAPLVTSRRVMDEAGLTPEDLARARAKIRNEENAATRL